MLNDYEIQRVEKVNVYPVISLLKLIACTLAVYCSLILLPKMIDEVYQARTNMVDDSLKIRVIANSNAATDQQLKLEMIESLTPLLKDIQKNELSNKDNDKVYTQLKAYIEKNYAQYDVKLNVGDNLIPPKLDNNMFYPQNYYNALVLTIGSGRGDNWWCSIFSNVCERSSDQDDKEGTKNDQEEDQEVKFLVWEWLKGLFS